MSLTKRWAEKIGWFEDQQYPQSEIEYQEYLKNKNEKDSAINRQNVSIHTSTDKRENYSTKDS
tara:strand:- start:11695 stop:11883 length:189 start_codon:yes stop_codon:yes gene_type:complete